MIPVTVTKMVKTEIRIKTAFAISKALFFPSFDRYFEKTGINELLNIPSENIFLKKSGILKHKKNMSLDIFAPNIVAINTSLKTPSMRLNNAAKLTKKVFFIIFSMVYS